MTDVTVTPVVETKEETKDVSLIIASKVKDLIKSGDDIMVSSDFLDALNVEIRVLCKKAVERCKGNGRKTLRGNDL